MNRIFLHRIQSVIVNIDTAITSNVLHTSVDSALKCLVMSFSKY